MTPKEFVKTWFAHIDAKKFDTLQNLMAKDHQFVNPMAPVPADHDQHLGMIQMMTAAFDGRHVLDAVISEGDWVTVRGRWQGKHVGEFNGIAGTGREVAFSWLDMMHVVNGKVEEEYFEMNPMAIMMQIGAVQQ